MVNGAKGVTGTASGAPVLSMTGFAAGRGAGGGASWVWEVRSVNGKGADFRLKLPDGLDGLEAQLRAALQARVARGNVTLNLRLDRDPGSEAVALNEGALKATIAALIRIERAAAEAGLTLASPTATDILGLRSVTEGGAARDGAGLAAAIAADFGPVLEAFVADRAREGAALAAILGAQIDRIDTLRAEAQKAAEARRPDAERALREALARVLSGAPDADPQRIAQELAMLAVKADVVEELDRLSAHVGAARALLAEGGAIGRKLDFLTQEFLREANTLCSKAGNVALTRIGLDLKTVIDQMREQAQNVE